MKRRDLIRAFCLGGLTAGATLLPPPYLRGIARLASSGFLDHDDYLVQQGLLTPRQSEVFWRSPSSRSFVMHFFAQEICRGIAKDIEAMVIP